MNKRNILVVVRLFFSLLTLCAIAVQLTAHLQSGFSIVNFFSYFTILSNLFAAVMLIIGAVYLSRHHEPTAREDLIRGASVAGMALVGVGFSLLLRGEDLGPLLPWVNTVTHYLMPVVVVLDWLYQPSRSKLAFNLAWLWLVFPLLYLVYTMIRGPIVGFYPYPFLNPANVGGYGGVLLYSVGILILFLIISWLVIVTGNRLKRNVV